MDMKGTCFAYCTQCHTHIHIYKKNILYMSVKKGALNMCMYHWKNSLIPKFQLGCNICRHIMNSQPSQSLYNIHVCKLCYVTLALHYIATRNENFLYSFSQKKKKNVHVQPNKECSRKHCRSVGRVGGFFFLFQKGNKFKSDDTKTFILWH